MNRNEFEVLKKVVQKRRGPKTRYSVVEAAFEYLNTEKGDRHARRYAERIVEAKFKLLETEGETINLANMHANLNGSVTDVVFDAAIESIETGLNPTRVALQHGCYSASVYNFIKCIKSAKDDYNALIEVVE
jgi:hypothetical protein